MVGMVSPCDHGRACSHPIEKEGRFLVHSALRADLKALQGMLDCFENQFKAGRPLTAAQKKAATLFLSCFLNFIRQQYLRGLQASERPSTGQKPVEGLLARFESETRSLLAAPNLAAQMGSLPGAKEAHAALHQLCLETFREEESLMHKQSMHSAAFGKEVTNATKGMDSNSLAAFIRPMTKEQRRAIVKQLRIPFISRWLLFRLAAQYDKKVWQPFQRECLPAGMTAVAWA